MRSEQELEHRRLSLAFVIGAVIVIVTLANDTRFWAWVEGMLK